MRSFIKANKTILAIILVIVIAAMSVIGARISIESDNKTYDIVLDYAEIEKLAEQSENDVTWWLSEFKKMGITKVGLQEENIMTLMEDSNLPVTGEVMDNIMEESDWMDKLPEGFISHVESKGGFDRFDVIVRTGNKEATNFVIEGVKERIPDDKYAAYSEEGFGYFWIDGTSDVTLYSQSYKYITSGNKGFVERADIEGSKIMYISLGLMQEKVDIIKNCGMDIIPRTLSYNGWNDTDYAEAVVAGYDKYEILPEYIIVGGEAVFGYDEGTEFAKEYIKNHGITIGLIEDTTQRQNIMQNGVDEVAIATDYDTVRVFSVWNYIQYRYQYYGYEGSEEIENTLFRAVTERNVRVIYFKPILQKDDHYSYVTNVEEYAKMFENLDNRLEEHGFERGSASTMADYSVSKIVQILIGIGAALGAVLLLRTILPMGRKSTLVLSGLGVLAVLAAYYVMPNTAVLVTSLAAAIVFACLGVTYYTASGRNAAEKLGSDAKVGQILIQSVRVLVVSVIIALVGGMLTCAPISSTNFMLEIDIFRGVKIAQLLPIAYFVVAFLAYYGYTNDKKEPGRLEWEDIKKLLFLDIKVWMVLALGVIGAVGAYYIMRTGHESSVEVSSMEMIFRNTLEEVLIARPRTKEFLLAFPAIMMMVYCAARRLKLFTLVFGLAGVLGITSVINTFMHIRTPLYLGFMRTMYSLIFGMVLGVIAIFIFEGLYRLYMRYIKKYV